MMFERLNNGYMKYTLNEYFFHKFNHKTGPLIYNIVYLCMHNSICVHTTYNLYVFSRKTFTKTTLSHTTNQMCDCTKDLVNRFCWNNMNVVVFIFVYDVIRNNSNL